jgi:hypothetical protein
MPSRFNLGTPLQRGASTRRRHPGQPGSQGQTAISKAPETTSLDWGLCGVASFAANKMHAERPASDCGFSLAHLCTEALASSSFYTTRVAEPFRRDRETHQRSECHETPDADLPSPSCSERAIPHPSPHWDPCPLTCTASAVAVHMGRALARHVALAIIDCVTVARKRQFPSQPQISPHLKHICRPSTLETSTSSGSQQYQVAQDAVHGNVHQGHLGVCSNLRLQYAQDMMLNGP